MQVHSTEYVIERFRAFGVGERVLDRIARLNPNGVPEGAYPRGFHRKEVGVLTGMLRGAMPVRDYIARFGSDAYRALPRHALLSFGGKRRGIRLTAIDRNGKAHRLPG